MPPNRSWGPSAAQDAPVQTVAAGDAAHEPVQLLALSGDLDAFTAARLRESLALLPHGCRALLDLSDVAFMDSAGLGVLIGGIRRIREREGDVAICCRPGPVRRMLHTTGLERLLPVVDDRDQALATLDSSSAD